MVTPQSTTFLRRDIDADLINLRAKLQYAVGMKDSAKRDNTEILRERLTDADNRICHLPWFVVPDANTSTKIMYYFVSGCILLIPYIDSMRYKLIWQYLSMDKEIEELD